MGDENPIRTLRDYSKPSHEGYRNTIELPEGNNVVPLRSDTIRLVQNGCSFHELWSEDPNQHLKDFLKLVDSLDLNDVPVLPLGWIFILILAHLLPPGWTAKSRIDIKNWGSDISGTNSHTSKGWRGSKKLSSNSERRSTTEWQKCLDFLRNSQPAELMREDARHPIAKNVNSISLIRMEEEENRENNGQIDKSVMEPGKSDEEEPPEGIDMKNEVERKPDDEPTKNAKESVTKNEEDEPAGVFSSHAKDPETPLLVGRGFLATRNAVIDYRKAKIAVGEGITRSIFEVIYDEKKLRKLPFGVFGEGGTAGQGVSARSGGFLRGTIDSVKSILTQSALDALCEKYYILDVVHPELLGRNDRIRNSPIGEREVAEGEVSLVQLTRGRVVPLAGVNDRGSVNVQGASDDDVNEGDGDVAEANQTEKGEHVVDVGGIDVVVDDEVQAIVADKPQRVRKKRKAADGASGSGLPPKKLREDHGTSGISTNTSEKSIVVLQRLLESSTLPVEVGVTAAATVPFVTSSVTPDSIFGTGLRTRHPTERFVISSDSSHDLNENDTDDEVTSIVRSSMPHPLVLTAIVSTTIIAGATSTLIHKSGVRQV
ncbi:hypothetical protein Tco_1491188 [Tanacetum coccineum]